MSGCVIWIRATSGDGYGRVQHLSVHRIAWEAEFGPIPPGKHVLHTCDNPPCYNTAHLWLGTNRENVLDSATKRRHWKARRDECPKGHRYDYFSVQPTESGLGRLRGCRKCRAEANRRWRARKRGLDVASL